jgi:hypothetical protein
MKRGGIGGGAIAHDRGTDDAHASLQPHVADRFNFKVFVLCSLQSQCFYELAMRFTRFYGRILQFDHGELDIGKFNELLIQFIL